METRYFLQKGDKRLRISTNKSIVYSALDVKSFLQPRKRNICDVLTERSVGRHLRGKVATFARAQKKKPRPETGLPFRYLVRRSTSSVIALSCSAILTRDSFTSVRLLRMSSMRAFSFTGSGISAPLFSYQLTVLGDTPIKSYFALRVKSLFGKRKPRP